MLIYIDSKEKERAITKIINEFGRRGIETYTHSMYVGDYENPDFPKIIIDRKQNLSEVYTNICHENKFDKNYEKCGRFRRELERADRNGFRLYFLIEHGGQMRCMEDVKNWSNPQLKKSPYAWNGEKLHYEMSKMKNLYDIEFLFCSKNDTGRMILELLS